MDLSYGPEYETFRSEVRTVIDTHRGEAPSGGEGLRSPKLLAWQQLLIEHGYTARTIPRSALRAMDPTPTSARKARCSAPSPA